MVSTAACVSASNSRFTGSPAFFKLRVVRLSVSGMRCTLNSPSSRKISTSVRLIPSMAINPFEKRRGCQFIGSTVERTSANMVLPKSPDFLPIASDMLPDGF